jgi:hypothetical protein
MKPFEELIEPKEPALALVKGWVAAATNHYELLPPSTGREKALFNTQVTTRSTLALSFTRRAGSKDCRPTE